MTVSTERLAEVFVEVADTLISDFDLIEFLQVVTARTAELVDAAAAGLLLADEHGELHFMAASDEATRSLELFQAQNHEGPCLDAYRTRTPVVNVDLADAEAQWPLFAPRAARAGFRSVHAIPLRHQDDVIGTLGMFGTDTGGLGPTDVQVLQALADIATIGLLQERTIRRGERVTEQLQNALNSRIVIEQAKGALARLRGVDVDRAFELLRTYSRASNLRLGDVAHAVLEDPRSHPRLTRG
jgi:GAF domain-containing protein